MPTAAIIASGQYLAGSVNLANIRSLHKTHLVSQGPSRVADQSADGKTEGPNMRRVFLTKGQFDRLKVHLEQCEHCRVYVHSRKSLAEQVIKAGRV